MSDPLHWMSDELVRLQSMGLRRSRRTVTSTTGATCEVMGRPVLNFAGNDYLDLARDPRVIAAAITATEAAGAGASASALITGHTRWHADLEEQLARFERQPRAILFPSGYAANVGTLCALLGEGDAVFCDRFNHASLVDGCHLSGARLRVYRHDDLENLTEQLHKSAHMRRRAIVTDSVFSMDGDLAPLPDLCELAERFDAILIVDEAHATGVYGAYGRGVAELQGVENRIPVRIGTLSKALGSLGGFVVGSETLIEWLWNRARTQMFSTALPPACCAAASAALAIVAAEPERRDRLLHSAHSLSSRLRESGLDVPATANGPIIPIIVGEPERAVAAGEQLIQQGFLVGAIRPPTVPQGTSRLRISLSWAHTSNDLRGLSDAILSAKTDW